MSKLFRLIKTASITERVCSSESCVYLYRTLKFIGWTPPEAGNKRYLYLFWSCLVFVCSTLYVPIGFSLTLIKDFSNIKPSEFIGLLQLLLNVTGGIIKTIVLLVLISRLHQAKFLLDDLDKFLQNGIDRLKIYKAVALSNFIFLVYAKLYLGYTLSVLVSGIIIGQPPWMIYNPFFSWRDGATFLWLQMIFEYITGSLVVVTMVIADTYPVVLIIVIRAHTNVLKDHIVKLRANSQKKEAENYDDLVSCINYHNLIIKCCRLLSSLTYYTIFIQFLLIGAILGLSLINMLYFSDIYNILNAIFFFVNGSFETFPFCYLCDMLQKDCDDLSILLGQSHWIDAEPKYKTTLRIFLHHLQQPIIFKAGGIMTISVHSNIKVAKFAFSVMTIVQQMDLANRFK